VRDDATIGRELGIDVDTSVPAIRRHLLLSRVLAAQHGLLLAGAPLGQPSTQVRIFGHHCDTDTLVARAELPDVRAGDILAMQCTGPFTYAMASNYNGYPRPAVVLVRDGTARLAVRRETVDEVLATDAACSGAAAQPSSRRDWPDTLPS
jgi:hypothetical protein